MLTSFITISAIIVIGIVRLSDRVATREDVRKQPLQKDKHLGANTGVANELN